MLVTYVSRSHQVEDVNKWKCSIVKWRLTDHVQLLENFTFFNRGGNLFGIFKNFQGFVGILKGFWVQMIFHSFSTKYFQQLTIKSSKLRGLLQFPKHSRTYHQRRSLISHAVTVLNFCGDNFLFPVLCPLDFINTIIRSISFLFFCFKIIYFIILSFLNIFSVFFFLCFHCIFYYNN